MLHLRAFSCLRDSDLTPALSYEERELISSPVGVHPEGRIKGGGGILNN